MTKTTFSIISWTTGSIASLLAIIAWGSFIGWDFSHLSVYLIFPVLGLLAFGLMWSHYILGGIREYVGLAGEDRTSYANITAYLVLLLILLHPGLYELQLFLDGKGIPPFSYLSQYPATSAQVALLLASLSFVAFLAFELHRWFKERSWWKYVEYANIVAMFAIMYHALTLGDQLQGGSWYQFVWLFYFVTLSAAIVYRFRAPLTKLFSSTAK